MWMEFWCESAVSSGAATTALTLGICVALGVYRTQKFLASFFWVLGDLDLVRQEDCQTEIRLHVKLERTVGPFCKVTKLLLFRLGCQLLNKASSAGREVMRAADV